MTTTTAATETTTATAVAAAAAAAAARVAAAAARTIAATTAATTTTTTRGWEIAIIAPAHARLATFTAVTRSVQAVATGLHPALASGRKKNTITEHSSTEGSGSTTKAAKGG